MSISSIAATGAVSQLQKSSKPEALEPRRAGPDHDGDADDRAAVVSSPKPVASSGGQSTGILVDTTA